MTATVDAAGPSDVPPRAVAGPAEVPLWPPVPPRLRWARIGIGVVLAAAAIYAPLYYEAPQNKVLTQVIYIAIAAMGLNLLTGFNGQVSIGHGAFFGVGAFTTAILMDSYGWTFEATIVVAGALAAMVGALVGFPALRVRGLYLALITLGLAVSFPSLTTKYVDGNAGLPIIILSQRNFTSLLDGLADDQWKYYLCLFVAALLYAAAWLLTRGRWGRAMVAVRDQELAAATVGVNLAATKVATFAISAGYAGIAGALSVMVEGQAAGNNPILYFRYSIEFLVAVVIGGAATILGPAVGALVLVLLRREAEDLIEGKEVLAPAVLGASLIAIVFVLPDGVVGGVRRLLARLTRPKSGGPTAADVPSWPPGDQGAADPSGGT